MEIIFPDGSKYVISLPEKIDAAEFEHKISLSLKLVRFVLDRQIEERAANKKKHSKRYEQKELAEIAKKINDMRKKGLGDIEIGKKLGKYKNYVSYLASRGIVEPKKEWLRKAMEERK